MDNIHIDGFEILMIGTSYDQPKRVAMVARRFFDGKLFYSEQDRIGQYVKGKFIHNSDAERELLQNDIDDQIFYNQETTPDAFDRISRFATKLQDKKYVLESQIKQVNEAIVFAKDVYMANLKKGDKNDGNK